jgi:pyridoxamine 5'-phosphate oxidase
MDELKNYINQLRKEFSHGALIEADLKLLPSEQFGLWLQQALEAEADEAHSMHLCTVGQNLKPSSRIVYLREFLADEYWFYTNYNSRKGQDLAANPYACLTFYWPALQRQIRIEGKVEKAKKEHSDNYFNSRPYNSKVSAWASNQSGKLVSREELEMEVERLQVKFSPDTITRPENWGGYVFSADYYEFWQGRESRLHDRICYELNGNEWLISRKAP